MSDSSKKPTVRAGRRRTSSQPSSGERQRAEAPRRQTSFQGSQPSGLPPIPGGGIGFPGGKRGMPTLLGIILVVVVVCAFIGFQLLGGGDGGEGSLPRDQPDTYIVSEDLPAVEPLEPTRTTTWQPTPTKEPSQEQSLPAANVGQGATWTVMLYQDADDNVLEQDIYVDLNEAEKTGSNAAVTIVSQVDRYRGAFDGDGNWSSTRRYLLRQDNDLERVTSELVADLGEANMSDPQTLVDFVTWAVNAYPADRYALILSDHGLGWPGGWSDPDPPARSDSSIPLSARLGNQLYLHQLDEALGTILSQTGMERFDLVGMDACLMGQVEVFTMLAPHARYAVASQEVEPALGWAYTGFLDELVANPGMDGKELSRHIVQSYIQDDQRILDEQARAEMLRQGSSGGMFGLLGQPSADAIARQMGATSTLTAVDLADIPTLVSNLNELAFLLQQEDQAVLARARSYAQSFTNIFGSQVPPSYIDLGSFLAILDRESRNSQVKAAVASLVAASRDAVLAEKHGSKKPGATGLSIYFPNSTLYRNAITGPQSYTAIASRFSAESLWDDFLSYHYTDRSFVAQPAPPQVSTGAAVRGPGAGEMRVSPLELSSSVVSPGETVLISADVSGDNIGHIYLVVGFYDEDANSVFLADLDYLESEPTRDVNGNYYPTWSESDEFRLEFEWEPVVFTLTDGRNSYNALLRPSTYGQTPEEALYIVDGKYTFADQSGSLDARLVFGDGLLQQVIGFSGEADAGAPRQIIPSRGDRFTISEHWMDLDSSGNVRQEAQQPGGTLVFGDQPLRWEEFDAAAGEYVIGFIVEDLDGNRVQSLSQLLVR